jgi:teichuronic acid biosynthesis glycosyltransferase TuaG
MEMRFMNNSFIDNLVSVIIPVYNAERYITETLESALLQTYKKIEIIIIDDCSCDNSFQVIEPYIKESEKVRYQRLVQNSGAAVARNKGISLAKGRFIAFLDSDDIWVANKTEKQLTLMKNINAAFSFTAIEMIDEEGKIIKSKRKIKEVVDYNILLKNTIIACSSVIIDRYITGDFQMPLMRSFQDYATWLMLLRRGIVAYGLDDVLVKYRKRRGSLSSNKLESIKKIWRIYTQYENISIYKAAYYLMNFVFNAVKKHYI